MARACIPVEMLFSFGPIPPPLFCKLCAQININVETTQPCPGVNMFNLSGGGLVCAWVGLNLVVIMIDAIKIEMGMHSAVKWVALGGVCRWVKASEGKVRRRFWDRRRAPKRVCGSGKKVCEMTIKGWVSLQLAMFKGTMAFEYFYVNKRLEWTMKVEIYHFWELWMATWMTYYHNIFWQKNIR